MKEKCVICKNETLVNKDKKISERKNYIEGVGQLCPNCYEKIIKKSK